MIELKNGAIMTRGGVINSVTLSASEESKILRLRLKMTEKGISALYALTPHRLTQYDRR